MSNASILVLTTASIVALGGLAHADDHVDDLKSETTALELSVGGTAASAAVFVVGNQTHSVRLELAGLASALVTPSLGEWYAGEIWTAGTGLRLGGAALASLAVASALSSSSCWGGGSCTGPGVMLVGGGVLYAGGILYDIATAPREARAYNRNHGWQLVPTPLRSPTGATTMGVGLGGSF
jgi:hypothetical protein